MFTATPDPTDWVALLDASTEQYEIATRSERDLQARRKSGVLLWAGAAQAIREWSPVLDPTGTTLQAEVLALLGVKRKASASKIKTVALATRQGLDVDNYQSLSAAYEAACGINRPDCKCTCHRRNRKPSKTT